jgi:hypothetical protein
MQIYIDTNVFLDFYQSATDRLAVFEEIIARAEFIVLTEQTITEFKRNRIARLLELSRNIDKASTIQLYTTAVARELPGFGEWQKARDNVKAIAKEMTRELNSWIKDESRDIVLSEFNKLIKITSYIPTSDEQIERARRRKVLGRPPTSPDKHTIGDELIWEMLLERVQSDLIIVSRDKTFTENQSLLKSEFDCQGTRSLTLVTDSLSKAFEKMGKPSAKVKAAEEIVNQERHAAWQHDQTKCEKCDGVLEETGFEGSDGDEAWWLYCTKCGAEYFPK